MYNNLFDNKIAFICENEYMNFFCKINVVGIALGYKNIGGFETNEKCIVVFVREKVPIKDLSSNDVIPALYKGIKTDVMETGDFDYGRCRKKNNTIITRSPEPKGELIDKIRPTISGYSIGTVLVKEAGTLGCLVTDSTGGIYILSNNHVLADLNFNPIGTHIMQPAIFDKGNPETDLVAVLSKFVPIKFAPLFPLLPKPKNYVDCAIAKVLSPSLVSPEIYDIGIPKGVSIPVLKSEVKKSGRTTGLTNGTVIGLNATIFVQGPFLLVNQIVAKINSDDGDSGSVLLDRNNNVVGLLVSAGTKKNTTIFNPIIRVLKELNVRLITE